MARALACACVRGHHEQSVGRVEGTAMGAPRGRRHRCPQTGDRTIPVHAQAHAPLDSPSDALLGTIDPLRCLENQRHTRVVPWYALAQGVPRAHSGRAEGGPGVSRGGREAATLSHFSAGTLSGGREVHIDWPYEALRSPRRLSLRPAKGVGADHDLKSL